MATRPRCYRLDAGAVVLSVRLTPKAARDAIDGIGRLSDGSPVAFVRTRALPEAGAANAALTALIAKAFRVPKSSVRITAGATGRLKRIRIAGEPAALARTVEAWPDIA